MTEQIIPFLTASILLTLAPGPDIIYVLVQGMSNGKKFGIITALGLVSGIIIHTSLVAFGISILITESEIFFQLIKIFGAAYLFFLAFQLLKSGISKDFSMEAVPKKNLFSVYKKGFLMNVLNPKVAIFFLAFFPGFLWNPNGNTIFQFYILGLIFMLQAFVIFCLVSILAGKISVFLNRHPSSGRIFKWLQIVVFIGIGVYILL